MGISHIASGLLMRSGRISLVTLVGLPLAQLCLNVMMLMYWVLDRWDREVTPMQKNDFGVWEVNLPARDGQPVIPHNSKVKVSYSAEVTYNLPLTVAGAVDSNDHAFW